MDFWTVQVGDTIEYQGRQYKKTSCFHALEIEVNGKLGTYTHTFELRCKVQPGLKINQTEK